MTSRIISHTLLDQTLHSYGDFSAQLAALPATISLCIDSRTLKPGEVFLAIRGDLDDGHNYIDDVYQKGASLVIADASNAYAKASMVLVPDTLKLLGEIAQTHLQSLSCTRIGITGSNGKTTTKEMVKAALAALVGEQGVYASAGNRNNLFGLPLCALEVNDQHRFAIFEMGMNQIGEMERLAAIARPHVAAITNISGAHAGNFVNGIEGVAHEKGQLFCSIAHGVGHAVINLDDENIVNLASQMAFKSRVGFGHAKDATVKIVNLSPFSLTQESQTVLMEIDAQPLTVEVPLAGAHHAMNAACALAMIRALSLSVEKAAVGIKQMTKIAGRMSVSRTPQGHIVINDGYNANPVSMKAGIEASHEFPAQRRIAVIGAMGELGHDAGRHHFELGMLLARNFDHLFICGDAARESIAGAQKAGMNATQILFCSSSHEAIEPLKDFVRDGDLLFIKGSLSSNMQVIAKALLAI